MNAEEVIRELVASGQLSVALRVTKVAALLDIGKSRIYVAIKAGEIRTVTIAGQLRVPLDELLRLLEQRDQKPANEGNE